MDTLKHTLYKLRRQEIINTLSLFVKGVGHEEEYSAIIKVLSCTIFYFESSSRDDPLNLLLFVTP